MGSYTFVNLQTRVSAEINDASNANVTLAQVKKAIVSAVEFYESERTWWGEMISTALVTVANFPAVAVPSDLLLIDKLQCATTTTFTGTTASGASTITGCSSTTGLTAGQVITGSGIPASTYIKSVDSSTQITMGDVFGAAVNATASASITVTVHSATRIPLERIGYDQWATQSYGASGTSQPVNFTYYQDRILLYPTPNAVYGLILGYVKRLTTLSADSDNNGWTNYAEPLIRARAKWDIFSNLLYLPELAQACKAAESEHLMMLDEDMTQRNTTGKTKALYL